MTFPADTMGGPQTIIGIVLIASIWYVFRKIRRR
jgi:LPXTG-motif cell wall-anchored protein